MLLGAHESVAGGAWNAIARGRADGCEALQIFARPAQQWRARPMPPDEVSMFRSEHATVGWPAMSHASYLINLCAGDPVILDKSRDALVEELHAAEELGLDFVVLHPGAHLGAGRDDGLDGGGRVAVGGPRTDARRARQAAARNHRRPGELPRLPVRRHGRMLERARGGDTMGICFDTCHAHAAGLDLSTEEGYERVFDAFTRTIGIERLRAFHLNDSKTPVGSRVDRHAEIGDGYLGLLPFWRLVNDARFAAVPGVLETRAAPTSCRRSRATSPACARSVGAPRPPGPPKSQALPDRADPRQGRLFAD